MVGWAVFVCDTAERYVRVPAVTVTTYRSGPDFPDPAGRTHPTEGRPCQTAIMTGYLDGDRPRAFAHRGWHVGDLAPLENTMAAFRRAVEEGFQYLETDVHATADGELVIFHDPRLDRVTDRAGAIASLPWRDVRGARVNGTEPIPLLTDLLEEFQMPGSTSTRSPIRPLSR